MLAINKILVPVDFSERSTVAALQASALARRLHSDLVLLHVSHPAYTADVFEGAYFQPNPALVEREQRELDSLLAGEPAGLSVRRVRAEGDPARCIVHLAHQENVGLIVMPTHGYGPFRRFILGSVTAKVLHDAECPVWTGVHWEQPPASEEAVIRNVLCAIDLSPHSRRTLCWAAQMAAELGAHLGIAHVTASLDASEPGEHYFVPEWANVLLSVAAEKIEKLQHEMSITAKVHIASGEAPKVVRQFAEEVSADLLVIGRSPHGGLAGRLRTNAYAIIRESPCPVVSV